MAGEFDYIAWLRRQTPADRRVLVGPGDDAAVLVPPTRPLLVTTDTLLEGSCFILAEAGAYRVGRKAMAVNLSDIAAMAGVPRAAVVSVALPRVGGRTLAEELYRGLRSMADAFDVPLVGGDTSSWDGPLTITVTLLGEATDRGPVTRSGAKVGDWIFVTGPLGGSLRGHHLDFTPRVREALALHAVADLHAMIDLSDGLAQDLHHICEESGVGAALVSGSIPRNEGVTLEQALTDGEDFELAFTVSREVGARLLRETPIPVHHIGEIVATGYTLDSRPLPPTGYQHRLT